jgi:hypothetical protein
MTPIPQRRVFVGLVALLSAARATAFVPVSPTTKVLASSSSKLQVLPSPAEFGDLSSSLQHVAQAFWASSSSTLLSDAAAVTADAVEKDPSWWDNYLQIFRNILVFVHTTVDQPLKNAGIENTWGISIALFTCGKHRFLETLAGLQ